MTDIEINCSAHNTFEVDGLIFSSKFDNGNLYRVEKSESRRSEYLLWTTPDNMGAEFASNHCAWFYFSVSKLTKGTNIRLQIMNASNHMTLYKQDMRPVYRCASTNNKWLRIRNSVRFSKLENSATLYFDHSIESESDDTIYFAFTYPYTYTMVQSDLALIDKKVKKLSVIGSLYAHREVIAQTPDGLNVDLITITNVDSSCDDGRLESPLPQVRYSIAIMYASYNFLALFLGLYLCLSFCLATYFAMMHLLCASYVHASLN